jgi:hypothetical protein
MPPDAGFLLIGIAGLSHGHPEASSKKDRVCQGKPRGNPVEFEISTSNADAA